MLVGVTVCLVCLLLLAAVCAAEEPPRGHLQPLGAHMPPLMVEELTRAPLPVDFNEKHVEPNRPVLFKGLLRGTEVLTNWQSDSYLRSRFGTEQMGVEQGKKENRSEYGFEMTMREFLDQYNSSNIYMVSDLSPSMREEWLLPRFLLCGGYTEYLMYTYIWFSSGGTKSVLHTDSYENLHCLVSGRKEFVLIEPQYSEAIGPEHAIQGFFNMDVERVDMYAYPNLVDIPWYKATVTEGDCLYIPFHWMHHVDSYGRNMGVNAWWLPFEFQSQDCDSVTLPDFAPLADFPVSPELQIKAMLEDLMGAADSVTAEELHSKTKEIGEVLPLDRALEMFEMLIPGCRGVISRDQLNTVSRVTFRKAFEFVLSLTEPGDHDFEYFDDEFGGQGDYDVDYTGHMTEGGGDFHDEL